jgi:hypothetical protein
MVKPPYKWFWLGRQLKGFTAFEVISTSSMPGWVISYVFAMISSLDAWPVFKIEYPL